jgi:serine kinase of HPr protein (carbohydrate metabolism regulator)
MAGVVGPLSGKAKGAPFCGARATPPIVVHGVLVQVSGLGVLIMGDSGTGKTACGLELVGRGGLWVADDAVVLERRGGVLYGRGHERTKKWIAVRGRGILAARSLLRAETLLDETRVHLLIRLIRSSAEKGVVRNGETRSFLEIAGMTLSCRRVAAGGPSAKTADEVIGCVGEYLAREKRGPTEEGNDETDARGNHHGIVRFG